MEPIKDRPEITVLLEKAVAAYKAMSPEEKRAMHRAQTKSWVIGNMLLSNPDMTREYAERVYDEVSLA